MTEKRFKKDRGTFWDKDRKLNMDETVELLNSQEEQMNRLIKENERLKADNHGYHTNYEMLKGIPVLFVGGVPYVSVRDIHKWAELVVLREKERVGDDDI